MTYQYDITEEAAAEVDRAITYYQAQFSSGAADFLTAFDDTIARILRMPTAGRIRSDKDLNIRGHLLKAEAASQAYAKQFPYLLLYKVYESEQKVVIFQLWPITSTLPQRKGP